MSPFTPKDLIRYWWVIVPVLSCASFNFAVRPILAMRFDGVEVIARAGTRRRDSHWTFDPIVRDEHPLLTGFLGMSDGQVALITLAAITVCGFVAYLFGIAPRSASDE